MEAEEWLDRQGIAAYLNQFGVDEDPNSERAKLWLNGFQMGAVTVATAWKEYEDKLEKERDRLLDIT